MDQQRKSPMGSPWYSRAVVFIASTTVLPLTVALFLNSNYEWGKMAIAVSPFLVAIVGGYLGLWLSNRLVRLFDE